MHRFNIILALICHTTTITMSEKQRYSKHFSDQEVSVFKDIMKMKYDLIQKYSSSANGKRKLDETWGEVADAVNAVGNGPMTVVQVKEKWRNLTKKAKTDYTAEQASLGKTGGGPALPEMLTGSYAIKDLLKDSASFSWITGADLCETAPANDTVEEGSHPAYFLRKGFTTEGKDTESAVKCKDLGTPKPHAEALL